MVDYLLDLRPHRFAPPEREIAGQHAPYPIVLGIVRPREHHRDLLSESVGIMASGRVFALSRGSTSAVLMSW